MKFMIKGFIVVISLPILFILMILCIPLDWIAKVGGSGTNDYLSDKLVKFGEWFDKI